MSAGSAHSTADGAPREDPRRGARADRRRRTTVQELELARAGAGRGARAPRARAASATPTTTRSTAPPRRAAPPCSATRERGSSRRSAPGVTRVEVGDHVALSWAPSCGACAECLRDLPQLCSTAWPAMGTGGLMDGTTRLSRDGEPVYHYSFLSTFAEACVVPEKSCVPIPKDVPFDVAGLVGCAVTTGVGAVWRTAQRAARRPRGGDRLRRCRAVGVDGGGGGRAPSRSSPSTPLRRSSTWRARSARRPRVLWAGSAEATADAIREVSGGGVDYAIEATGRPEAMTRRVPLDASPGRGGADRDPARGRDRDAAGAVDPAPGAARARLDLRLVAARARLRHDARRSTARAGCRSTG